MPESQPDADPSTVKNESAKRPGTDFNIGYLQNWGIP